VGEEGRGGVEIFRGVGNGENFVRAGGCIPHLQPHTHTHTHTHHGGLNV
jgi:hypothetical protein